MPLQALIQKYIKVRTDHKLDSYEAISFAVLMQRIIEAFQSRSTMEYDPLIRSHIEFLAKELLEINFYEGIIALGFLLSAPEILALLGDDDAKREKHIREYFQVLTISYQCSDLELDSNDTEFSTALRIIFKYISVVNYLRREIDAKWADIALQVRSQANKSISIRLGVDDPVNCPYEQFAKYIELFPNNMALIFFKEGYNVRENAFSEVINYPGKINSHHSLLDVSDAVDVAVNDRIG